MPTASTRAALAAVSAPAPSTAMAMASLSSRRATLTSSSSISSTSSSSSFSAAPSSQCCWRQASSLAALSASRRPLLTSSPASTSSHTTTLSAPSTAAFSTTTSLESREKRRRMRDWLKQRALPLFWPDHPLNKGQENENMENRRKRAQQFPMPNNNAFRSEPVLDQPTRYLVYKRVVQNRESIKSVAASIGLDMRRVAAIVRLMSIERQWFEQGKPLAQQYNNAVLGMLPTFGRAQMQMGQPFEKINEIHDHAYTKQQLFVPVPESRQFNREDAAKAFNARMLSPDKRMPVPELIQVEKDVASGKLTFDESVRQLQAKANEEQFALYEKAMQEADAEEKRTKRIYSDRFEFRVKDYNAEEVGKNGRAPDTVGWRYGVPFSDRKRNQVKTLPSIR